MDSHEKTTPPPGLDLGKLLPWFRKNVAPVDDVRAEIIGHGRSNLTYRLTGVGTAGDLTGTWVLRRPPLSHVLPTAHDMLREFRVISALGESPVPVPEAIAFCDDPDVMERPFYVMSDVRGSVPTDVAGFADEFDARDRAKIAEELLATLAALHAIDPDQVGLADFGKPAGYIDRQIRRFVDQLDRSRTRDVPDMDELARRLGRSAPAESGSAIVHGDYRLDNTIIADRRIAAVLDWEMATLGDPLADVGMLMMYWADPESQEDLHAPGIASIAITALEGFPTRSEAADLYADLSGRDLSTLDFYLVLAYFKLAVILEGIHARYKGGGTVGEGFETIGDVALTLARVGMAVAERSSVKALRSD